MDILDEVHRHMRAGIAAWETSGELAPFLWARGKRTISATPFRADADMDIADLLVMLGRVVDARIIGRTAEAWVGPHDVNRRGTLAELADADPTIRTAVLVHAADVRSGEQVMMVAMAGLDDDGEPNWSMSEITSLRPDLSCEVGEAAYRLNESTGGGDLSELAERVLHANGWTSIIL